MHVIFAHIAIGNEPNRETATQTVKLHCLSRRTCHGERERERESLAMIGEETVTKYAVGIATLDMAGLATDDTVDMVV